MSVSLISLFVLAIVYVWYKTPRYSDAVDEIMKKKYQFGGAFMVEPTKLSDALISIASKWPEPSDEVKAKCGEIRKLVTSDKKWTVSIMWYNGQCYSNTTRNIVEGE